MTDPGINPNEPQEISVEELAARVHATADRMSHTHESYLVLKNAAHALIALATQLRAVTDELAEEKRARLRSSLTLIH